LVIFQKAVKLAV